MVIGGADDPRQFGFCDEIDLGVTVTVTDMTGAEFTYTVSRVDRSSSAEASWLTDAQHDLTLFCRDQYSMEYLAVRCRAAPLASIRLMSGQESRGSVVEYQADEQAGVARLSWRVSGR